MSRTRALERRIKAMADSFVGAMLGALVYAAWAVFANWSAGPRMAFEIGAVHWACSAFLTYTGTGVMRRAAALGMRPREAMAFAFVAGLAYTYLVLVTVHQAIGTPHVLLTLAAGVIPNLLFCGSYALLLLRTSPSFLAKAPAPQHLAAEGLPSP